MASNCRLALGCGGIDIGWKKPYIVAVTPFSLTCRVRVHCGFVRFSFLMSVLLLSCVPTAGDSGGSEEAASGSLAPTDSKPNENTPKLDATEAARAYAAGRFDRALHGLEAYVEGKRSGDELPSRGAVLQLAALQREAGRPGRALELLEWYRAASYDDGEYGVAHQFARVSALSGRESWVAGDASEDRERLAEGNGDASAYRDRPQGMPERVWGELLLFEGRRARLAGEYGRAQELLVRADGRSRFVADVAMELGFVHRAREEHAEALAAFRRALRHDRGRTMLFLPVARTKLALNQDEAARARVEQAVRAMPWSSEARDLREELQEEMSEAERDERQVAEREHRREAEAHPAAYVAENREEMPMVRVGIGEEVESVSLKTGGAYRLTDRSGTVHRDGEAGELLHFLSGGDRVQVIAGAAAQDLDLSNESGSVSDGGVEIDSEGRILEGGVGALGVPDVLVLQYDEEDATSLVFDVSFGRGIFSAGAEDRSYRGALEFQPRGGRLTLVNELPLEEYLYSVVPSEMPASWPRGAVEAQAVAARSYTLANLGRFSRRGYDVSGDVRSAHYRGVTGEHPAAREAVDSTAGLVLEQAGEVLNAVYSANAAGYTEAGASVWGGADDHIAVADPKLESREAPLPLHELWDWILDSPESYSGSARFASSGAYRWRQWVTVDEIDERLGRPDIGRITAIVAVGRGISGRAEAVEVRGTEGTATIRGDAIRPRLGDLRSNLFVAEPWFESESESGGGEEPEAYPAGFVFDGAGWGHGVGMCQTGAAAMAADGYDVADIVGHYYPRADLTAIEDATHSK